MHCLYAFKYESAIILKHRIIAVGETNQNSNHCTIYQLRLMYNMIFEP